MLYSCHRSYVSRVSFTTASAWVDATGARGQNACLHAKQDGDVVAYAARALFAPRQDFPHQAVMNLVLPSPLADRDALVIQPSTCLNMSTKFFHGKIGVIWCRSKKLGRGGLVALGKLRVIGLLQLSLIYAVLVGHLVACIGKLSPVFDLLIEGFKGEGLKGSNCKGFVLVHFFALGGVFRFGLDLVGVIMNTHLRICKHYLSNSNG